MHLVSITVKSINLCLILQKSYIVTCNDWRSLDIAFGPGSCVLLFLIKWQQTPAAPSSSMTKIGRTCFILGIFLQTGWGRTLITSCSPWWWSWETFSATWAPANETSLARSYWNESRERLELAGCMLIMLLSWGSLCGACVDSAPVWGFLLFLYIYFLCQGNVSLAVIPLGAASLGGRPFNVSLCRLSLLVLLHVCFRIVARLFPAISSRPQHMYWAWEMIIKAHHPQADRQADSQMISTQYF